MNRKTALLDLTYSQLYEMLTSWGEPSYRARQLWEWIYSLLATDFEAMTNLPKALREKLQATACIHTMKPVEELVSRDGLTRKFLFSLADGETVESVLMFYQGNGRRRRTACLSTQVGCPIGCPFCATGQGGFVRNLSAGEIIEQALYLARRAVELEGIPPRGSCPPPLTNVVMMGMGEPFLNYEATWQAIEVLNDKRGFNLGARRFTISTVGIVPGIRRLARERLQVGLAISLHAPSDELRNQLVPINRRYPLSQLLAACREYVRETHRRITFEYALIQGLNDSVEQARKLARLLRGLLCHVNLIPLNPVEGSPYRPSGKEAVRAFQAELTRLGVPNTLRLGRGSDIQAGCGQLRRRNLISEARL